METWETLTMSQKEAPRAGLVKAALAGQISNAQGACAVGISVRQFRRLKARYRQAGVRGLLHGLRGRASPRALEVEVRDRVLELIQTTYRELHDSHCTEKLREGEPPPPRPGLSPGAAPAAPAAPHAPAPAPRAGGPRPGRRPRVRLAPPPGPPPSAPPPPPPRPRGPRPCGPAPRATSLSPSPVATPAASPATTPSGSARAWCRSRAARTAAPTPAAASRSANAWTGGCSSTTGGPASPRIRPPRPISSWSPAGRNASAPPGAHPTRGALSPPCTRIAPRRRSRR